MSLIDEALKRARDQASPAADAGEPAQAPPRRPVDPWSYAPLPHARRRSPGARWLLPAAFAVIVAGAAAWIWTSRSRLRPAAEATTTRTTSSAVLTPVAAAQPPEAAATPPPAPALSPAAPAPVPARVAIGMAERPPRVRPTLAVVDAANTPAGTTGGPPPPQPMPRPAGQAVDGRTYVGAVVAPNGIRVELGGIVSSETNASALLNGRILPVGGVVEGLTITSIDENRVELSGDGVTIHRALR